MSKTADAVVAVRAGTLAWLAWGGAAVALAAPLLAEGSGGVAGTVIRDPTPGPYMANWESLRRYRAPEWLRDDKFGIYTHWGPLTVATEPAPALMERYGQQLYLTNHPAFAYHRQRFGDPHTAGYKDVIPHFKAERFDAEAWAELFERAGAKFAGWVAIHHDNFALWDSVITRWNSRDMGPRRDLTGELEQALRRRGLRFLAALHHGAAWEYFEPAYAYDAADGRHADLYGEPHPPGSPPSQRFLETWLLLVDEVLQRYGPDLLRFDLGSCRIVPEGYQQRMLANYYNWAARHGREVGVAHQDPAIQQWTGIADRGGRQEDRLMADVWLTDASVGPWFHHAGLGYRTADELVDALVDVVAKNGCFLLNVGPQADGRIPEEAQAILSSIGEWLRIHGEAIYATRPWTIYGEGPTRDREREGSLGERANVSYTAEDIRFTTRGEALYALGLAWPGNGQARIRSLAGPGAGGAPRVIEVQLLGYPGRVDWTQTAAGLAVRLPAEPPMPYGYGLKIAGRNLRATAPSGP
ncbi:MAG: alpha-L-fucosidase [Verrucomicrobia bacterium]|nr:alpha-L-fucosidase [Verrucomicrobiota bacterium]